MEKPRFPAQPPSSRDPDDLVGNRGLNRVLQRLTQTLERDRLVQDTLTHTRQQLGVDRLVLYYFFRQWRGQVTCEALSQPELSILGSSGADECFNDDYAERYLAGRVRAIADITQAGLATCHLEFLESLQVKANLVVPILVHQQLWGLLVAHHCQHPRNWADSDISLLQEAAKQLAMAPAIQGE
jgi:GAF domain-containing protein